MKKATKIDSDAIFFSKIGPSAILETLALVGELAGAKWLAERFFDTPTVAGLPIVEWLSVFVLAYASSFIGSIVEGGLNAATNQVLQPNVVQNENWYAKLQKPSWNPPGWVFPIMWLIVSKPTQMIAVSKVLKAVPNKFPIGPLSIFCFHLSLGNLWNKVFFGMQCIGRGTSKYQYQGESSSRL